MKLCSNSNEKVKIQETLKNILHLFYIQHSCDVDVMVVELLKVMHAQL